MVELVLEQVALPGEVPGTLDSRFPSPIPKPKDLSEPRIPSPPHSILFASQVAPPFVSSPVGTLTYRVVQTGLLAVGRVPHVPDWKSSRLSSSAEGPGVYQVVPLLHCHLRESPGRQPRCALSALSPSLAPSVAGTESCGRACGDREEEAASRGEGEEEGAAKSDEMGGRLIPSAPGGPLLRQWPLPAVGGCSHRSLPRQVSGWPMSRLLALGSSRWPLDLTVNTGASKPIERRAFREIFLSNFEEAGLLSLEGYSHRSQGRVELKVLESRDLSLKTLRPSEISGV